MDLVSALLGADAVIIPCSYQNSLSLCLIPSRLTLHLQVDTTVQIMNGLEVASWHVFINFLEIRPFLEGLGPWGGDSGGHRAPCMSI